MPLGAFEILISFEFPRTPTYPLPAARLPTILPQDSCAFWIYMLARKQASRQGRRLFIQSAVPLCDDITPPPVASPPRPPRVTQPKPSITLNSKDTRHVHTRTASSPAHPPHLIIRALGPAPVQPSRVWIDADSEEDEREGEERKRASAHASAYASASTTRS